MSSRDMSGNAPAEGAPGGSTAARDSGGREECSELRAGRQRKPHRKGGPADRAQPPPRRRTGLGATRTKEVVQKGSEFFLGKGGIRVLSPAPSWHPIGEKCSGGPHPPGLPGIC